MRIEHVFEQFHGEIFNCRNNPPNASSDVLHVINLTTLFTAIVEAELSVCLATIGRNGKKNHVNLKQGVLINDSACITYIT